MSQKTIDNSDPHRIYYMKALKNALDKGDISQYQADKLRKEYDD